VRLQAFELLVEVSLDDVDVVRKDVQFVLVRRDYRELLRLVQQLFLFELVLRCFFCVQLDEVFGVEVVAVVRSVR